MPDSGARELERRLSLGDLMGVVVGAIVGVGVFFQPAKVVDITGSPKLAILAWVIGSLIAMTGSLTFAELGTLFPRTGGQYLVLKETYGRFVGFLYCWSLLCIIQSGAIAIISIVFVQFFAHFLDVSIPAWSERVSAALLIAGLTAVNAKGVRNATIVSGVTTILKALILAAIILAGFAFAADPPPPATRAPEGDGSAWLLLPALIPVLFSYGGWQQGTYLAGEVKDPARNLPRGIIGGVLLVAMLYVNFNVALLRVLPADAMVSARAPAAVAMGLVFGPIGERLTGLAVAVSALGVASVCIMTAPRMYKAIADDGCFFRAVGEVHPGLGTPAKAIAIQGAIAIVFVLAAGMDGISLLTTGVVCIDWVFFFLTGLSLFILRRRFPDAERPYRATGHPVLPGLFVLAAAAAVAGAFMDAGTRSASLTAVLILSTGALAFLGFRRRSQ